MVGISSCSLPYERSNNASSLKRHIHLSCHGFILLFQRASASCEIPLPPSPPFRYFLIFSISILLRTYLVFYRLFVLFYSFQTNRKSKLPRFPTSVLAWLKKKEKRKIRNVYFIGDYWRVRWYRAVQILIRMKIQFRNIYRMVTIFIVLSRYCSVIAGGQRVAPDREKKAAIGIQRKEECTTPQISKYGHGRI